MSEPFGDSSQFEMNLLALQAFRQHEKVPSLRANGAVEDRAITHPQEKATKMHAPD
jgi:hypothetical protein